jgi:hypothetical protein
MLAYSGLIRIAIAFGLINFTPINHYLMPSVKAASVKTAVGSFIRVHQRETVCMIPPKINADGFDRLWWQNSRYYTKIKKYDLAKLWHDDLLAMEGSGESASFPEPLGYIGDNYQRFKIHYTSVKKDPVHPYRYLVAGKTMFNNSICVFTGTITIIKADLLSGAFAAAHKQGELIADIYLKEDAKQEGSGNIRGKLKTAWHIDQKGNIIYDTINCVSDNFSNNQFTGTWTSNASHQSKKCNWGDFRIPQSGDLDVGAGEFTVNPKYAHDGWQSYSSSENKITNSWWN